MTNDLVEGGGTSGARLPRGIPSRMAPHAASIEAVMSAGPSLAFNARLVAADRLEALRASLRLEMEPVGGNIAADFAEELVMSYPTTRSFRSGPAPDRQADIYSRALIRELKGYPRFVLNASVRKTLKEKKFMPSVAEVVQAAEEMIRPMRVLRARVEAQIRAHEDREAEAARERSRLSEKDEMGLKEFEKAAAEARKKAGLLPFGASGVTRLDAIDIPK